MKMNGERIIKKGKKTPKLLVWAYAIGILAIITSIGISVYKMIDAEKKAIDFTTNGALNMKTEQYAYLEVEELDTFSYTINENSKEEETYYIAMSLGYPYVVKLDSKTLKQIEENAYTADTETIETKPVTIYGMTESVPQELKQKIIDELNFIVGEDYAITVNDFELYFGTVLLNTERSPADIDFNIKLLLIEIIMLFCTIIIHIRFKISRTKIKKYLKVNHYKEDIIQQLDNFVEEEYYHGDTILTNDFLVDIKEGLVAFKYSDIKWLYIRDVKIYTFCIETSIFVHLKDGKTKLECAIVVGKRTNELMDIFHKLCEKAPEDALKGYTQENIKAYKEYKKSLKNNNKGDKNEE